MNNILLVLTDQQRWDSLGRVGGWTRTPVLDALAECGVLFRNCYSNAPVCAPARVALATGRYPHNFGLWQNSGFDVPTTQSTWMKKVRQGGLHNVLFGKAHLHKKKGEDLYAYQDMMRALGYDEVEEVVGPRACVTVRSRMTDVWQEAGVLQAYRDDIRDRLQSCPWEARPSPLPLALYPDVYIADRAIDYLKAYDRDKPWCLTLGFPGPHEPWDCPEPYASAHDPANMPLPLRLDYGADSMPGSTLRNRLLAKPELTLEAVQALRANYAGSIELIDTKVGEVLKVLAARGELDDTWIIFASDHGELNGDYGLLYKNAFFDAAAKVPLIVVPPSNFDTDQRATECWEPVELFDLAATIVDIVGQEVPQNWFAKSLVPLLQGRPDAHRPFAMVEFRGELMYADRRWKLCLNRRGVPYLLVDRHSDPGERANFLVGDHGRLVESLRLSLLSRLLQTQHLAPVS